MGYSCNNLRYYVELIFCYFSKYKKEFPSNIQIKQKVCLAIFYLTATLISSQKCCTKRLLYQPLMIINGLAVLLIMPLCQLMLLMSLVSYLSNKNTVCLVNMLMDVEVL